MNYRRQKKAFKKMINFEPMTDNERRAAVDFAVRNFGSLSKPRVLAQRRRMEITRAHLEPFFENVAREFVREYLREMPEMAQFFKRAAWPPEFISAPAQLYIMPTETAAREFEHIHIDPIIEVR